jgi:hypothetical protein
MLDEQFSKRLETQARRAARPELRAAIKGNDPASRERLTALLKEFYDQSAPYGYIHWVIADRDGVVLVNYPPNPRTLGKNYSWRDWFNGTGDKYEEGRRYEAITAPHISQPFVGQSVDRIVGINISSPIKDSDGKDLLGVLTVMIDLDKIYRWLYEEKIHRGFFVLLNQRYHCLVHKHRKEIEPKPGKNPPTWERTTVYRDLIGGHREGLQRCHHDPIDGHDYAVSYAPLRRIGWGLLIQQERDPIIHQLHDDLRPIVHGTILVNTIICSIFVPGLWGFIIWTLRKGEGAAHG